MTEPKPTNAPLTEEQILAANIGAPLVLTDLQDRPAVEAALRAHGIDAVLHFAAYCYVGESVAEPAKYWANNVHGTLRLAEACLAAGVRSFVFSSSFGASFGSSSGGALRRPKTRAANAPSNRTRKKQTQANQRRVRKGSGATGRTIVPHDRDVQAEKP